MHRHMHLVAGDGRDAFSHGRTLQNSWLDDDLVGKAASNYREDAQL